MLLAGRVNTHNLKKALHQLKALQQTYGIVVFMSINQNTIESDPQYMQRLIEILNVQHAQVISTSTPIELQNHEKESGRYNMYSMFYHNKECFRLVEESKIKFDVVIKYRADLESPDIMSIVPPAPNTLYIPQGADFNGLNDQIAYGPPEVMKIYCDLIDHIPSLVKEGVPYNPELLLNKYIAKYVRAKTLKVIRYPYSYSIFR